MTVAPRPAAAQLDTMPARWLPLLYYGPAHLCLAAAFLVAALDPHGIAGFFYHPRLLALVHLVTLGWISASILGSLYLIGPLTLRLPLPARRLDYWTAGGFWLGTTGMVSHFWIERLEGMAWSGALVWLALAHVSTRVLSGLRRAVVAPVVKLHIGLACANVLLAGALGVLIGVNKYAPFLPHSQLAGVYAHAHLGALGWGTMMVMGAGYRLIPMILPAAMPKGRGLYATAALLELGTLVLAAGLLLGEPTPVRLGAALVAVAIAVFLARIAGLARQLRPPPSELPRPDAGVAHALAALLYLLVAAAAGLALTWLAPSETSLRVAMAYGVLGLIGFLAQIVVGVEGRLLPLYAWLWGFADTGHRILPGSQYRAPVRSLQVVIFALWTLGVPLLAAGLALDRPGVLRAGAAALAAAVLAGAVNVAVVLRRLWKVPVSP